MVSSVFAILVSLNLISSVKAQFYQQTSPWPKFRQNNNGTSVSPSWTTIDPNAQAWRYKTGGYGVYSSPAIGSDGTIYVGAWDYNMYAINKDGTLKWKYPTTNNINSSAAIGYDGTIYFGSRDFNLYAVNPGGLLKWKYLTGGYVDSSPAISSNGTLFFASRDTYVYALNSSDGKLMWQYPTGDIILSSPAIGADGIVYVGSKDFNIYALNTDGSLRWKFLTGGIVYSSPSIASDGTIYVGSGDLNVYALHKDGTLRWKYLTGGAVNSSPAISSNDTIYVGSSDSYVYALNATDGSLRWRYKTGSIVYSSPAIGTDGTIYVGSRDYYFYALNTDGTLKWRNLTGGDVYSSPGIGADGTIYVGSFDSYVYALNPLGIDPLAITAIEPSGLPTGTPSGMPIGMPSSIPTAFDVAPVLQKNSPWPKFRQNNNGTSITPSWTTTNPSALEWKYRTGGYVDSSPAIASDGTIYVGSWDKNLYALNADGSLKWKYLTGNVVYSSPALVSDGTVYVGSNDTYLYALNSTGMLKWRFKTGNIVSSSPAVGLDGTIYVGSRDFYLYALNYDGSLRWRYLTGGEVESSPAIGPNGTIYVGSYDSYIYAIYSDGTLKWRYLTDRNIFSSPAIASYGTIYVGSVDSYLYALNPDGSLKWRYLTGDQIYSSPAIGSDGTVYVGSHDNYLYALNLDGTLKWRYLTEGNVWSSPAIGPDDIIYFGSNDFYVYGLNSDGSLKWRNLTGDYVNSSPAIGEDGMVYVGSFDQSLCAMNPFEDEPSGMPSSIPTAFDVAPVLQKNSPWPKFRQNNNGTSITPSWTTRDPYSPEWKYETGGNVSSSPAIASDGTIYVGSKDFYLYAIKTDGALKWRYKTGHVVHSSPAIASDGTIYVGSHDFYLYAIRADGTLKWRYRTESNLSSSPSIASDGTVYVGSYDNYLYALNPDGTLKWKYLTMKNVTTSSPAIGPNGTIYVGSEDCFIYALNSDGSLQWKFRTLAMVRSSPTIAPDGIIYVGSSDRVIYALNTDGSVKCRYPTGNQVESSPAIGSDGTIYVGSRDGYVYALNTDGTLKWRFLTGSAVGSVPAIASDGTIYVGSSDSYIYALNADGSLRWKNLTGGNVDSSPAIGADGRIYVGSYDNYLYVFNINVAEETDGNSETGTDSGGNEFMELMESSNIVPFVLSCSCLIIFCVWIRYLRVSLQETFKGINVSGMQVTDSIVDLSISWYGSIVLGIANAAAVVNTGIWLLDGDHYLNGVFILICYGLVIMLGLVVMCFCYDLLIPMRYRGILSKRMHAQMFSMKSSTWAVVCVLSIIEASAFRLLPWRDTQICKQLDGFPLIVLYKVIAYSNLLKSIWLLCAVASAGSWGPVSLISLISSVMLILITALSIKSKLFGIDLVDNDVVIVAKSDFENMSYNDDEQGVKLNIIGDLESIEFQNRLLEEEKNKNLVLAKSLEQSNSRRLEEEAINRDLQMMVNLRSRSRDLSTAEDKSKLFKSATPHADENADIRKKQLLGLGVRPVEYIPLADIRAELAILVQQVNNNEPFDERRLDHLLQCMEWNKDYIAEQEEQRRQKREEIAPFVHESLEKMRAYIPPEIFQMTLKDLTDALMSRDLSKRIFSKKCLWLLRMSATDIGKLHVADLSNRFGVSGQGLDIIELAAVYGALQQVQFEADAGDKKDTFRKDIEKSLLKEMDLKSAGKLSGNKLRHISYRGQEPLYGDRSSLYSQDVVVSDGAFGPRTSFSTLGGTRATELSKVGDSTSSLNDDGIGSASAPIAAVISAMHQSRNHN